MNPACVKTAVLLDKEPVMAACGVYKSAALVCMVVKKIEFAFRSSFSKS